MRRDPKDEVLALHLTREEIVWAIASLENDEGGPWPNPLVAKLNGVLRRGGSEGRNDE